MGAQPLDDGMIETLAPEFSRFSEAVAGESAAELTPTHLVDVAAKVVPNAIGCALTIVGARSRPRTLAASNGLPITVDKIQYDTGQGPCLDALDADELIFVQNLATDERWPDFSRRCVAETSVRSMIAVRLRLGNDDRAAMNLYSDRIFGFDDIDLGVASMFAPFVSMSVQSQLEHRRAVNLETALASSRQIGTAMGILMARNLVTSDQAFELLSRASQHLNRKLRDVAAEVEMTGSLPEMPRRKA